MDSNPRSAKRELDKETVERYERIYQELLEELRSVQAILAAFGKRNAASETRLKPSVTAPIIYDLREYLRERGEPCHQSEIIRAVGDQRHKKYPTLLRPWGDVWKSLEYHNRNRNEIVCVEWQGEKLRLAKLKEKPRQPRVVGGKEDSPEFYSKPDNLFWFSEQIAKMTKRRK
jgi:hypothetical protein